MNQLKVGSLLSYIDMTLHILIGLVYVPLILHFLSIEEYGLYQLIGSLAAYLSVMDFGLSNTITRYYSQRLAVGDKEGQENVLAIAMILYVGIGILVLIVGFVLIQQLGNIFGSTLSVADITSARRMLLLLVINVALTIPSNVFQAAITSNEKFVFLRMVTILRGLLNPFLTIAILSYKAEALSIVQVQVALNIAVIVLYIWFSFKKMGLKIHLHSFERNQVTSIVTFSFFIFLNAIVNQIYWKTGQFILGIVSGTTAVAVFSISIQIVIYYMHFSTAINGVFLPKISKIVAVDKTMSEINSLFVKVGRIQYALLGLILSGFIIFGREFIELWVGKDFLDAYTITLIIMIPFTIDLIQNLGILILQAKNKHAFRSIVFLLIAILNVIMSIPLAKRFGGLGCAIATGFCLFIGNGLVLNIYYKRIGIDILTFFKQIGRLSLPIILVGLIGMFVISYFDINGWNVLLTSIVGYSILYILVLWLFGFNKYEKGLIISLYTTIRNRFAR